MYCTSCGKPNSDVAKFCTSCGKPLIAVQQQSSMVVPVAPTATPAWAAAPAQKKSNTTLTVLLVIGGLFLVGIVLLVLGVGFAGGFRSSFESPDQAVARLMREAAGVQPVQKSFFGEDKVDTRLRDLFRKAIQLNKDYEADMQNLDIRETHKLATPESFADPSSAAEGLRQLHAAYDLDARQEQRLRQLMEDFRHQFDDVSAFERESFDTALNKGLAQGTAWRQRAVSAEKAWVDAMDDVYNYADQHHADFVLRDGHVEIADDSERQEFNTRVHTLNARRHEFEEAKAEFDRGQHEAWQKMGVTGQQVGAH